MAILMQLSPRLICLCCDEARVLCRRDGDERRCAPDDDYDEQIARDVEGLTSTAAKAQKIVSALRGTLEGIGLKDSIRTVRDLGYVFERFD